MVIRTQGAFVVVHFTLLGLRVKLNEVLDAHIVFDHWVWLVLVLCDAVLCDKISGFRID